MSRKNALPLWQSSSITATNLSSSFLLLLATSTLFFLAILLIDPTNSLLVLARPSSSLNSHRNREITVEEQQQLVELTEESRSSEVADGIRYGLTEETTNEEGRKTTSERTLSRDTFFSLDPEPNKSNDDQIRQRTSQNSRALRGQRKRHRNRNRGEQQQRQGIDEQIGADGSKKEEEDDRLGLVDGQSLLSLTSVDIVNTTLQANTCRGDLFKHKVRVAGCRPKTITNRFCHGSCSSFYIPRLRSKKLKATFQSCAACVPSETDLVQVRLDCPNREEGHIYRTIVRVKKCACRNIVLEGEENDDEETSTAAVATITDDDGMMNVGGEDSGNDGPSFATED